MRARDLMTTHPSVVMPGETVYRAAQLMRDRHVGLLPVIDNLRERRLLGVITDRDIVTRCLAAGHTAECMVKEHMTALHLTTVHLEDDVQSVAHKMRRDHVRRIPVLSEDDRVVGVVAVVDLATRLQPPDPGMVVGIEREASAPSEAGG